MSIVCRRSQELLRYHFNILHRSEGMMQDFDAISRSFDPLIPVYIRTALVLSDTNRHNIPDAYTTPLCDRPNATDFCLD